MLLSLSLSSFEFLKVSERGQKYAGFMDLQSGISV